MNQPQENSASITSPEGAASLMAFQSAVDRPMQLIDVLFKHAFGDATTVIVLAHTPGSSGMTDNGEDAFMIGGPGSGRDNDELIAHLRAAADWLEAKGDKIIRAAEIEAIAESAGQEKH